MLIFPPEWVPTAPYLALPSLASVLRQNGIEVTLKDINVEAFDHYFSAGFLNFIKDKIASRLEALCAKEQNGGLSQEDLDLKGMLNQYTYVDLPHHIKNVLRAKEIMRSERFYKVHKAEWALNAFREVMEYISAAFYPASINFPSRPQRQAQVAHMCRYALPGGARFPSLSRGPFEPGQLRLTPEGSS